MFDHIQDFYSHSAPPSFESVHLGLPLSPFSTSPLTETSGLPPFSSFFETSLPSSPLPEWSFSAAAGNVHISLNVHLKMTLLIVPFPGVTDALHLSSNLSSTFAGAFWIELSFGHNLSQVQPPPPRDTVLCMGLPPSKQVYFDSLSHCEVTLQVECT